MELEQRFEKLKATHGSAIIYSPELEFASMERLIKKTWTGLPVEIVNEQPDMSASDLNALTGRLGKGPACLLVECRRQPRAILRDEILRLQQANDSAESQVSVVVLSKAASLDEIDDRLTSKFGLVWGI